MSSIKQCTRQVAIISPTTCRSSSLWKNYQSFTTFTKIFISFSLIMHNFDSINIQRLVVNTFFENVSFCNLTFWSSSVGNVSFQFSKILCNFIPHGKDAINGCIKGSNYFLIEYIHWYCIGPLRIASWGKWIARWTITSKNARGKNLSSLHSIRTIRSFSFSNSLVLRSLNISLGRSCPTQTIQY